MPIGTTREQSAYALEVFFDDSQIEVYGKKIEGARINYNGDLALSFQALWVGPVLVDALLGAPFVEEPPFLVRMFSKGRHILRNGRRTPLK